MLAEGPRAYREVMEAWRTSCPKLPVWEDASDRGLITSRRIEGQTLIQLSPLGRDWLKRFRPQKKT